MFRHPKSITLIAFAFLLLAGQAHAQAICDGAVDGYYMDWTNASWPAGSSSQPVVAYASDANRSDQIISVNITGDTDRYYSNFPAISNTLIGDHGSADTALNVVADFSNNSQSLTTGFSFPTAVENLAFEVLDIDERATRDGVGGFRDSISISASGPSGSVAPVFTLASPSTVTIGGGLPSNAALGDQGQVPNGTNTATLYVSFDAPVTNVIITYSNSLNPPSADPDPQGVGVYDLSYCVYRPRAEIVVEKTQKLHLQEPIDCGVIPGTPDPDAKFAVPGACIEYKITAKNLGDGVATDLDLDDLLDPNLVFWNAEFMGFSSGGTGHGLSAPGSFTDCSGGNCPIHLENAELSPGQTGIIIIRATVK